ncbi:hypothetical protein NLN92_05395 [Citrobacter portucalensis]|uniref:hypothetical protein n=1 Tax=Citrobacter portucalensis TaxID=1639133 RepID=UPI00226BA2D0|nr:hypothetical protein [Citrobacter portucalensis]MCX8977446.1 hypothetical protein [Citrobacter portucalensis]
MMEIKNARATERHIELNHTPAQLEVAGCNDNQQSTTKPVPKKHKARVLILRSGATGITENEILRYCRLSSGRNYLTDLERRLDIQFERIDEPNPDGIGSHYRYRFIKRADVQKVITLVNASAATNGHQPLNQLDVDDILKLYPDNTAE